MRHWSISDAATAVGAAATRAAMRHAIVPVAAGERGERKLCYHPALVGPN